MEWLDLILELIKPTTYSKVVLYLVSSAAFSPDPENAAALQFALKVSRDGDGGYIARFARL